MKTMSLEARAPATLEPIPLADCDDRLSTIWAIVESRKPLPSLIVVTSATDEDNTAAIARGLAQVSQGSGQRTAYLSLAATAAAPVSCTGYTEISMPARNSSREAFDAGVGSWPALYDVVFVDVGRFSSEAVAAHVARLADALIIAVCEDRRVTPADRELKATLGQLGAKVIGIVKTRQRSRAAAGIVARRASLRARLRARLFPTGQ